MKPHSGRGRRTVRRSRGRGRFPLRRASFQRLHSPRAKQSLRPRQGRRPGVAARRLLEDGIAARRRCREATPSPADASLVRKRRSARSPGPPEVCGGRKAGGTTPGERQENQGANAAAAAAEAPVAAETTACWKAPA